MLRKIYNFLTTNVGIALVFLSVFFLLYYPVGGSVALIRYQVGIMFGNLLGPVILILVLSRKYHWTRRQKIVNTLLVGMVCKILLPFQPFALIINLISIISLVVFIIIIFRELIWKKKKLPPKEEVLP